MNNPTISFLLPAYKAQFFEEALQSIRHQTYMDFTCLVSDDCSPEDLKTIFDRTVGDDPRFTYRRNTENMGSKSLVSHWNLLVDFCQTDYFVLASDDDVYDPHFLEQMMPLSQKYPQVDLLRARCRIIADSGVVQQNDALSEEYEPQDLFLYRYWGQRILCIANYIFRTSAIRDMGGYPDFPLAWGTDDATVLTLCKSGVASPNDILFSFRRSGANISTVESTSIIRKKFEANKLMATFLQQYISELPTDVTPLESHHYKHFESHIWDIVYGLKDYAWILPVSQIYKHYKYLQKMELVKGTSQTFTFFRDYFIQKICR